MPSIERITVKLPDGFDASKHQKPLEALIAKTYGEGFELESIDLPARTASATRQSAITEVAENQADGLVRCQVGSRDQTQRR